LEETRKIGPFAVNRVVLGDSFDLVEQLPDDAKLRGLTAPDLPKNLESCHLFPPHGCPHRAECHRGMDPFDLLAASLVNA